MKKMFIIYGLITGALIWFIPLNVNADTINAYGTFIKNDFTTSGTFGGSTMLIPANSWPRIEAFEFIKTGEVLTIKDNLCLELTWFTNVLMDRNKLSGQDFVSDFAVNSNIFHPTLFYAKAVDISETRTNYSVYVSVSCVSDSVCTMTTNTFYFTVNGIYNNFDYNPYALIQSSSRNFYIREPSSKVVPCDYVTSLISKEKEKEAEKTRKGILATIKDMFTAIGNLPGLIWNAIKGGFELIVNGLLTLGNFIIDGIKSLFIPEDMSFINDFIDTLSNKLGFIGIIPAKIIQFMLDLANASFTEINSISLPTVDIFGYNFWSAQEIDLTEAKRIFQPFKYLTDLSCVFLVWNTLMKWKDSFASGGGN